MLSQERNARIAALNRTHGLSRTIEYATWKRMNSRCYNANTPRFYGYGGRGIIVCDRWRRDFTAFLADMGPKPKGASIDRIDNDGPYSPENCRWSDPRQQANNTRRNRRVTFNGRTHTVAEWARLTGLPPIALWLRLFRYHWPIVCALTRLPRGH